MKASFIEQGESIYQSAIFGQQKGEKKRDRKKGKWGGLLHL